MFSVMADVNTKGVSTSFLGLIDKIHKSIPKALEDTANEVLRLTQFEVPHDEGTLQNSGVVEEINSDIVLGYHTPYAARLHEHPEYHFQKGRKGKYIEDPINRNKTALNIKFGRSLQTRLF